MATALAFVSVFYVIATSVLKLPSPLKRPDQLYQLRFYSSVVLYCLDANSVNNAQFADL
jgi:hypothetical protein